ncbi:MAG: aminotransferase class V-fold PLP-dependent enzyme [Candidatus Levyibacteriota bacterium]
MKHIYFTPGPSQLFPTVPSYLQEAIKNDIGSISHRSKQFDELFEQTTSRIRTLFAVPQTHAVFFVGSGTEAMERVIQNCVTKESFHVVNGSFAKRFFETAVDLGKKPKKIDVAFGTGIDLQKLKVPSLSELICITHNETSAGVMLPADEICKLKKRYPNKLLAVDTVSSAPYGTFDFSAIDIFFFSVQKGFGLPAGLGVMIVGPNALEKSKKLQKKKSVGSYHAFSMLFEFAKKYQTPETPPVLHIYLLNNVLGDFLKVGRNVLNKHAEEKAKLLYDYFDNQATWSAFVKEKAFRSPTVIVAEIGKKQKELKAFLAEKNCIVGSGYGPYKDTQIRIANFPAMAKKDIEKLIAALKAYDRSTR